MREKLNTQHFPDTSTTFKGHSNTKAKKKKKQRIKENLIHNKNKKHFTQKWWLSRTAIQTRSTN